MVLYSSFGADRAVLAQLRDRGGPQVDSRPEARRILL
jgi:hypothetical protein